MKKSCFQYFFRRLARLTFILFCVIGCKDESPSTATFARTGLVTNISSDGALFSGDIHNMTGVTSYGFGWTDFTGAVDFVSGFQHSYSFPTLQEGHFEKNMQVELTNGKEYYVSVFAVVKGKRTLYGDFVKFKSLGCKGPQITGFDPKTAVFGSAPVVTLHGVFSQVPGNNIVKLGNTILTPQVVDEQTIKVTIPGMSPGQYQFSVTVDGKTGQSSDFFTLTL